MPICTTSPHAFSLNPGQLGLCHARRADEIAVLPEAYGRITSLALDPIEKKPISRWRPGTTVLSLGGYGCNMRCQFCQNDSISQVGADGVPWQTVEPAWLVEQALALASRGCVGIAYTYNEPLITWEFLRDTAQLAHEAGLVNVLVSNGMANAEVIGQVAPLIDAANIDLKCFTVEGYRSLGGDLAAVKHTIETLAALPTCHLEVTTLVVPGLSDDEAQIEAMAEWIAGLDACIPYHLSRFFPRYKMQHAIPTPISTMHRMQKAARHHLSDVILGNM
ncbi:MAG: radical SAM protein [Coriobacteriia bacterium]|nr:radical SAM protein [Coriobacteriia bacterium]